MALTDYVDFTNNYLVKNGMIGNATNFNKSIDKLKLEVDELNTTKVQKVSSTNNSVPRFDGTSGDLKNSSVTISDTGVITGSLNGNAGTATALQTPRLIGGVSFNGTSDITLPGVNATGNQSTTGNAGTATTLQTARNIALTGDVTGNVNFDGSANVSIAATIAANSVALGTDTTGNYVAGVTQGTGISVTGTAGEGWTPVVSLTNVGTAGTYRSVTTDAQGRVTAGTNPTTLSGYGITDAQTASRTSATFTTAANTWYRIATSVVGIERNSAEFVVDWAVSGNHGSTRFAAACHYGESAGVSLMQTNYAKYGTGGITEARIVYHTTITGNYAYVEVKFAAALTSVVVNVEMQDPLGWTLVTPSTAGSIPSGYTSYVHTFIPSAAITAGTYPKVTINQEGRVISGSAMLATDIPDLDASKITSGTLPVVRGGTGVTTSTGTGSVVLSTSPTLTTPNIGVATGTSFNSITGLASVAPIVAGTAAVGTSTLTARQDHVHPAQTTITGNAGTATTLQTARTIGASGDVIGTATSFNGSANITIPMTLANSGVTAGTYSKVTVDAKGRVTAGATQTMEDIPDATFKRSVRCATTANITLSGTQTIDGIAVVAGDRVLVKEQTTSSQNGIYVVAAGAWTRSLDADSSSKIASAIVAVDSGTLLGGKLFDNDFKTTDTLGTTAMTWNTNLDDGSLLTAGSTAIGMIKYNGTTAAAGQFDGGTTTPTGTTRLNFGGYFYPTYINLIGSAETATASSHVFVETASDGYVRPKTLANFKSEIFASPTLVTPNIGVATGTSFNSITGLSATTPLMNGTAAVGTGVTVARADHVHPSDTTKVAKVTSTDNAIVRFNGTTGEVQNSSVVIDDSGNLLLQSGTGTLGYGAGAGGTVTQLTSKNTSVTLNKPTGAITVNGSSLAPNDTASFILNNSTISYTDIVIMSLNGGMTDARTYNIWSYVSSGYCQILIKNISALTLAEAFIINFAIIKGVGS